MKQFKHIASLLGVGTVVATVALTAYGYGKLKQQDATIKAERLQLRQTAPNSNTVPPLSSPSVVKRVSETEAPTLRGMAVNGSIPYICEFKGEKGLSVKRIFSDEDMPDGSGGAFYANGKFYVASLQSPYVGEYETYMTVYDANTWEVIEEREGLLPSSTSYCTTYDPQGDVVYGYFVNDDMDNSWQMFGRMNLATGEVLGLNNVDSDESFLAIACGTDGYLYGVNKTGMYCRITKKGEITKLGHTDIKPQYVQSAAIDPATGKFYWAGFTDEGRGGLYTIDPETYMATLIEAFPGNQEIIGLYVVENQKEADMPEDVKDITLEFVKDSHDGKVTFTAPDTYCDGKKISGALTAHVAVDGNHYEKSVAPGASVTLDVSVKYAGLYNIATWVSTAKASSNKQYAQKWIGKDTPTGVKNLKASVNGSTVTLSWDAPTIGTHGGYVNPDDVRYIIDRDGYDHLYLRDYDKTVYEDVFGEDVSADVRYSVRPSYNDYGGTTAYTEWIHVGPDVMSVPVSLSANGDYKKFIVIDANGDDNTWETSWSGCAIYSGGSQAADDWMLTPMIQLESGIMYQLEYNASAKMGVMTPEIIEVKCGQGETPDSMTQLIDSQEIRTVGIVKFNTYTVNFSVPQSGLYRLGFHAISNKGNQLGLAGIEITKLTSSSGPVAPTALSIEAAPKGELKATIRCTLPSKDSDGKDLTGISKVELYNGDTLAATVTEATPGGKCELTDNNAKQGTNRYSVVAYGADGTKGLKGDVSGWVGIDVPRVPRNLNLTETGAGAKLSWTMSETGQNGGYVDLSQVVYMIVEPFAGMEIGTAKGVTEIEIAFEKPQAQTPLAFGLIPMTIAGSPDDAALSPTIIVGPGYELPFHEHFGRNTDYYWSILGEGDDDLVGWIPEEETIGMDGQPGVTSYYGEYASDRQQLASGKISIPAGSDPTLTFALLGRATQTAGGTFSILVSDTFGKNYKPIYEKKITDTKGEWENVQVSMKEFAGKDIYIALDAAPAENGGILVGVDNVAIREVKDYDGAVTNITLDTDEVEVSRKSGNVQVWIANYGNKAMPAGDYTIDFYAGNRMFASLPGLDMAALFGYSNYSTVYEPTTDDADPSSIYAKISFAKDQNESNNRSKELSVYVVRPELPSATNLEAERDGTGVVLTWEAADQSGKPVRTITDDFESYRTFDIDRAGKWTIIDEDQQPGQRTSYYFPGSSGAKGWVVIEPGAIPTVEGGTLASRLPAYSGEKYMAAYCSTDSKDWLITPELSGNAQEISFMARAESFTAGREMFEVYYSTTGTELEDFISLDGASHRTEPEGWSEFRFKVPAGAKYFAVRCVSHNRLAMHIDDFTYESAATPVDAKFIGYNIYRNGKLLNDKPVTETSYRDRMPEGSNEYVVRAVYDRGEAPASNVATIGMGGLSTIGVDIDPMITPVYNVDGLRVYKLTEGEIYVSGGERFIYRKH